MDKERLLNYVAPCSLVCYTCMGCKEGAVAECAKKLYAYNEGVCEFRGLHMSEDEKKKWEAFFREFHETLSNMSTAYCPGCRKFFENDYGHGFGCLGDCMIPACVKEHGIDFCAECNAFPCNKARNMFARHDDSIGEAWEKGSRRLHEVGLEAYFAEKKDVSHYLHYKEKTK